MRGKSINEQEYEQIRYMAGLGMKSKIIASITGRSISTVSRINRSEDYQDYLSILQAKAEKAVAVPVEPGPPVTESPAADDKLDTIIALLQDIMTQQQQMIDIWTTQDKLPEPPRRGLFGVKKVDVNERR